MPENRGQISTVLICGAEISGETIDFGNDELRFLPFASRRSLIEFRPIVALPTLDFRELIDKRPRGFGSANDGIGSSARFTATQP